MGLLGGHRLEHRRYAGAAVSDRTSTWSAPMTSANTEIASSINMLRARSRQLVRDDGWPSTAVRRIVSNAIGDGLRCTIEHPDEKKRAKAQALFNRLAESTDIDADGRLDFYGMQGLSLREVVEGGDSLARRRWRRPEDGGVLPFQVQMLEPEHLDETKDTFAYTAGGKRIKRGIEFDGRGKRTGYWLRRDHPGEFGTALGMESVFVPAASVAHAYRLERIGQVSGVPWGAPVLHALRMLGSWKDATLYRLQASACLVAIVTGTDPVDDPVPTSSGNATKQRPEVLNPGSIIYEPTGGNVTFSNPPGVQGVDNFARFNMLEVAAAYGVPYEVLTGDLSNVNYSSGRMGWIEFGRELVIWRRDVVVRHFCDPVFRWFLEAAEVAGELVDDGMYRASWTPSRREFVDAEKEIRGIVAKIRAGLSTWAEEARALGWSPEELIAEYAKWQTKLDLAGLSFESDPRRAVNAAATAPAKEDEKPAKGKAKGKGEDEADDESKVAPEDKPEDE